MKNVEYKVKARMTKEWFFNPKLVYDVVMEYESWYDPSYGNGGGEYVPCTKRIATFLTEHQADLNCRILNRLK